MADADLLWAELVLHVLAHLESTAVLPSSLFDAAYLRTAREHLGPAEERDLGRELAPLAELFTNQSALCAVQLVARLHPSLSAALRVARQDLAALDDANATNLGVRTELLTTGAVAAELLRCAALLEADTFLHWPLPDTAILQSRVAAAMPALWPVAPKLRTTRVELLRTLGHRGRAWPDAIWVGIPQDGGEPSLNHVLWQAAHEAVVLEVAERSRAVGAQLSERGVEQCAVALLARRAEASALSEAHAAWLSRMAPEVRSWAAAESLSSEIQEWLAHLSKTCL